jgi:hypothetical protein
MYLFKCFSFEELDGSTVVRFSVPSRKFSDVGRLLDGCLKVYYLEFLYDMESTLSRWLHLQSLAPTNPHWARVVGYCTFSLCNLYPDFDE